MHVDLATILRHLPGAIVLVAASTLLSLAQEHDRSKIPDEYKWESVSAETRQVRRQCR